MKEYYIYTLTCPIHNTIRYVGFTLNTDARLKSHCLNIDGGSAYKIIWIKKLNKLKLKPIIEVIDCVSKENSYLSEIYWINQLREWGFKLYNHKHNINYLKIKSGYRDSNRKKKEYIKNEL